MAPESAPRDSIWVLANRHHTYTSPYSAELHWDEEIDHGYLSVPAELPGGSYRQGTARAEGAGLGGYGVAA